MSSALLNRAAQSHRHDARVPALLHVAGKRPMYLCRHTWRSVLVAPSGSTPATTTLASRRRTFFVWCGIDCDLRSGGVCRIVTFQVSVVEIDLLSRLSVCVVV